MFLRSVLILSSHLRLGISRCVVPSGYPAEAVYELLMSPMRATCPTYLILLDLITLIFGKQYKF